ncbi:RDD family protein [Nocardioides zhouii]|uniref:FHA domain-containing protein n=1 Tax=Nocardioides zhouii TaxID=1168729 RepID=A0A4Q2T250_9ACTN|nr:RDD family protein [Nocardioides zhouii]RYC11060.1 FHA domain-containing protein [Nocardioides zhouii]
MSLYPSGSPATMGRRVAARLIDSVISGVLVVAFYGFALAAILGGGSGELTLVLVLLGLYSVFSLWSTLARAALPGQLMLGLHHVDHETGRRAGGRTFLKYGVQSLTFGLAILITPLSIQAPNRSWFDRLVGVTLVDPQAADADGSAGTQVAAPPAGWRADESQLTQMGLGVAEESGAGAMIQSVPFQGGGSQVGSATPAVRREAGVVEPRPAAPAEVVTPQAVVAPRAPQPVVVLDTGQTVALSGPIILGRAPRQSASLGTAELVVVVDQGVSANHLALGIDHGAPWVMDLNSTNGSWVDQDGRGPVRLEAMSRLSLSPGATIRLGQRTVTVTAR